MVPAVLFMGSAALLMGTDAMLGRRRRSRGRLQCPLAQEGRSWEGRRVGEEKEEGGVAVLIGPLDSPTRPPSIRPVGPPANERFREPAQAPWLKVSNHAAPSSLADTDGSTRVGPDLPAPRPSKSLGTGQ